MYDVPLHNIIINNNLELALFKFTNYNLYSLGRYNRIYYNDIETDTKMHSLKQY